MRDRVSSLSLRWRLLVLASVILLLAIVTGLVGVLFFSTPIQVVVIAFLACLVSAILAHLAGEYPKGNAYIAARMAVQMVVRTAVPTVVVVWGLYFAQPPLEKSLVFYMILFYFAGLITDVQLTLARLNQEKTEIV